MGELRKNIRPTVNYFKSHMGNTTPVTYNGVLITKIEGGKKGKYTLTLRNGMVVVVDSNTKLNLASPWHVDKWEGKE